MQDLTLNQDARAADQDQDTAQDKAKARAKERDAAPKAAAPVAQPIQLDMMLQTLESLSGNPTAILQVVTEGMRAGIISAADVRFIEMFLQGGLSGRPINPAAHASLKHTGAPLAQVKVNEQLPAFLQAAGAQGAAFGDTVVLKPNTLDEASNKGLPLLAHELKHVSDHLAAGTLTAIHFDAGQSNAEPAARAAAQATVKDAFSAEIAQIIDLLKGHTSDNDVVGVLRILSHWDSATITQAWNTIGAEWREDLLDNLAPVHFKQFSRELLATYKHIPEAQRYQRILQLTDEGWFNSVSEDEATQVLYLLQGLSPAYQAKFQQEDGGKRYTRFQRKLPSGAAATLSAAVNPEREKQLQAQTQQRREQAAEEKQAASQTTNLSAEDRVRKLLSTGVTDWAVTDAEAKEVFNIFKGLGSDAAIGGMVRKLEADGLIDKWLNNLPDAFAFAKANVSTLLSILKHRPPESALAHAEKLLSYGLFDWAVTDSEAILAYHLIRALPPSAQQVFRRRDEAQWFVRMEQNLSGDVIKGKVGAEGGYGLVDDHGDPEKQKAAEAERARDTQIIQTQEAAVDALAKKVESANDATAPALLAELVGDGGEQCRAFTKHLDRLGLVQALFSALGANAWTPANRRNALTVLQHRDPMHNIAMIRDVLSYGLFDWEVKSDEARIAYEMIRALPSGVREEFVQTNPTWFDRMDGNISLELRESEDFGTYKGGEGDRSAIIAQLFEAQIWTPAQSGRLRMVLQMAIQAGERAAAAPLVKEHWSGHNAAMFEELGFNQQGTAAAEHVIDKTDTNTVKMITQGVDALFKSEDIDGPLGDTMGLRGLQMSEVQEATGGHLSGIRFGQGTKDEDDPNKQDKGEVDLSFNQDAGHVKFKAANLPVQSVNVIQGATTIRAGAGQMLGADIDLKWATATDPRTHLHVALQTLELKDLMIIREDQMFAVGSLALNDFLISGQRVGPMPAAMDKAGALETIGNFIVGILKVLASIVESLDDYVGDIAPLNPIFDPAKQGPGMAEQIRAAFSKDFNVNFKLGGLKVRDVVDSKGGHVQGADIGAVNIDVILSQAAHARAQAIKLRDQAKAQGREPNPAEAAEIQRLEQQAADWDAKAHERQALQDQKASGALTPDQTARLALLDRELSTIAIQGGIQGGLSLQGVNIAGVKADSLRADGVTIGGQVSGVNLGLNPADQLGSLASLEASANGQGAESFSKEGTGVELKAESVTGQNISYTGSARRDQVLRDTIKGLEAVAAPTADQTKALEAARAELAQLQPLVDEFLALDANVRALNGTQRARYVELRQVLSQAPAASVQSVSATNLTAAADLGSNSVRVGADQVQAENIHAGDNRVERVTATDLHASANLTEGKESASVSVGSGQATGVQTAQGGIAQVDLSGFGANVKRLDATTFRLDNLDLGLLSAQKVNISAGGMTLRADAQAALEGLHVAATAKLKADDKGNPLPELQNLTVDVAQLKSLRGEGLAVEMPGSMNLTLKKGSIDDIALHQFDLAANTFQSFGVGAAQVQGLVANISGGIQASVGNLKATSLTATGLTAGTVKLSLADLSGDRVKVDMPGLGLEVTRFQGAAVQDLSLDQASGQVDFPSITLASLNIAPIRFAAAPRNLNLASFNTSDVKVEGTANLLTAAERKAKGLPDDASAIESLHIKALTVGRAAVNGMDFKDSAAQQHVTMKTGFVNDLRVTNFDLNTTTFQVRTGAAGLQGLDAAIGEGLRAKGDVNAAGLGFGMLSDDRMTVDLNNVTAAMQVQMKEGNNVNVIDLKTGDQGLSGSIEQKGLTTTVRGMSLGSLQLPRIDWTSGSKHITSAAPLTISGVTFDGSFQQAPAGSASPLAAATIDRLHVSGVQFSNLTYRDGATTFTINEKMQKDMGLSIAGIDVTALQWSPQAMTGQVNVDKITGSQLAVALGADMQAGLDFAATDLNVAFKKNGDIVASIADLDASIRGNAAGAEFQANLQDLSTGDIIYGQNRVSVPNLSLGELSLPTISYKSPDYVVGLAPGAQGVKLSQITTNVTAHMRADGGGLERVQIHSLRVPTTTINGLKIDLPAQGASIRLPTNESGVIRDMTVQDFNLAPAGDGWAMDGAAGIGGISLPKVTASMKDTLTATTDINVGKIDLKMLKDGQGRTVDIASVSLSNTQANLDGLGSFQITRGASAQGIHVATDAAGNNDISVDKITANGLIYDDGNMRVVIDSAALPQGFQMPPNGEIKLPQTAIENAQFLIRDISKLTGGGASDQSSGGGLVDYSFLDTLNGKLNAYVDINWAPDIKNLEIAVNNGVFDFAKFEDSLPGLYDFALDFELKGNQLMLVADPFIKVAELSRWSLDDQEKALAKMGKIKMSSLVGDRVSEPAEPAAPSGEGITTPVRVMVKNLNGDFSMRGPSTINLGDMGKVKLGSQGLDGMLNFNVNGNLNSEGAGKLNLGMKALNLGLDGLNVAGMSVSSPDGGIRIQNVKDTQLHFNGLNPSSMRGTIERAVASGITVKLPTKSGSGS